MKKLYFIISLFLITLLNLLPAQAQKVGLVLSGGGAKGLTHIGIIRALEENEEPWTEIIRLPFMMPGEDMMTESGFGKEVVERLPELEKAPGVWCASYFAGMPWVDCAQGLSLIHI